MSVSDDEVDVDVEVATPVASQENIVPKGDAVSFLEPEPEIDEKSHESIPAVNSYQIKPTLNEKFKAIPVKEIIRDVVSGRLTGKTYDTEKVKKWTISIANDVNERIKELQMRRYRHVVQVILGEMKGAGVKSGVRCLWDSDTDGYTSDIYMNETIFCVTTVFAVYLY